MFNTSLKWNKAQYALANQGQKALVNIYKLNAMCGGMPPKTMFDLFDKMVAPVLCYGAEVWGYERHERIERVHTQFCKRVLCGSYGSYTTSNVAVYGDCGRYLYFVKCIQFFTKQ